MRFAFDHSDGTSGYRDGQAPAGAVGGHHDDKTVRQVMGELHLVACQQRPFRPVTTIAADAGAVPDLVRRDLTALIADGSS